MFRRALISRKKLRISIKSDTVGGKYDTQMERGKFGARVVEFAIFRGNARFSLAKKRSGGYHSRFVTIDRVTGEEVEGTPVWVAKKVRWEKKGRKGWLLCFQDAFDKICEDKEMTGEIFRVWMCLMSKMGFENFVIINRDEVAKKVKISPPNVSRAVKKLIEKGLLVRGPKVGRSFSYRLSLDVVWKGSAKAYDENMRQGFKKSAEELAKERWNVYASEHLPREDR